MIVLNAGVPRSGTVLVNAILRKLFEGAGVAYGQANPHGAELPKLTRHLRETGQDRHKTIIVHTHSWDNQTAAMLAGSEHFVGFANYRDPRDVCVSLMRLHEHDFETAAQMVEASFKLYEATVRSAEVMTIAYELLSASPAAHIHQIAGRLGLRIGLDRVAGIEAETSIDHHRSVMEKVQAGTLDKLARRQNTHRVLVEDTETLINDRHIQSGAQGRWRSELPSDLHQVANERFAPILKRYGYAL